MTAPQTTCKTSEPTTTTTQFRQLPRRPAVPVTILEAYQVLGVAESRALVRSHRLGFALRYAHRLPFDLDNRVLGRVRLLTTPRYDGVKALGRQHEKEKARNTDRTKSRWEKLSRTANTGRRRKRALHSDVKYNSSSTNNGNSNRKGGRCIWMPTATTATGTPAYTGSKRFRRTGVQVPT